MELILASQSQQQAPQQLSNSILSSIQNGDKTILPVDSSSIVVVSRVIVVATTTKANNNFVTNSVQNVLTTSKKANSATSESISTCTFWIMQIVFLLHVFIF